MARKTYDYIVVLKQRDFKVVDRISLLMLLFALIVLLEKAFTPFSDASVFPITIAALILGWIGFTYVKKRNGKVGFYRIGLLFAGWGMLISLPMPYTWITAAFVIAAVMEKQVKFPREIAFDEEEIVFNTFPRQQYHWSEFSNIILKDGLLTMDMLSNKLIQKELDSEASPTLEKDFNEFCKTMIEAEKKNN
jgi:hypothetical protein